MKEDKAIAHLKLKKQHPNNAFRILDLVVSGYQYKPYEITEAQANELLTEGAQHWVSCKEFDEEESEEIEDEITDEEKEALAKAEELKDKSEDQNPAQVEPTASEASQNDKPAPDLLDENKVIEDKPSADQLEYDALKVKGDLSKKEKARLAELKVNLKIEE